MKPPEILHALLLCIILTQSDAVGAIIHPTLQLWRLRFRGVKVTSDIAKELKLGPGGLALTTTQHYLHKPSIFHSSVLPHLEWIREEGVSPGWGGMGKGIRIFWVLETVYILFRVCRQLSKLLQQNT